MPVIYNQATLSYSGGSTNSNTTASELVSTLTAEKSAISRSYLPGDNVAYVITIQNSGTSAVTDISISDDLGAYAFGEETRHPLTYLDGSVRYYLGGALQPAPAVTAGPPLEITGLEIPGGSNAIVIYEAQVTAYAPLGPGAAISNAATINASCLTDPLLPSAQLPVTSAPRLTISKSVCPAEVAACGPVTYTFVIQNSGAAEAAESDQVVLSDRFDPPLTDLAVTMNDTPWSDPAQYTYDAATGLFSTLPGQITVPAATFAQNDTGAYIATPGVSVLVVTGTI